jgi:spore coat protein U-like protein
MTSSFQASVQVTSACTVSTVPLHFGPIASGETAMQTVLINTKCTMDTPYQLLFDAGLYVTSGIRNMADGAGNTIPYRLYKDTLHSVEWVPGVSGATSAVGTGLDVSHTLHGVATPSVLAPVGLYTDMIIATILY